MAYDGGIVGSAASAASVHPPGQRAELIGRGLDRIDAEPTSGGACTATVESYSDLGQNLE